MLISVTSRPDPGVFEKVPSWWKYRSPSNPLPGTARTSLTETMRPAAEGVMWMESTVPLNILEASLSLVWLQTAQPGCLSWRVSLQHPCAPGEAGGDDARCLIRQGPSAGSQKSEPQLTRPGEARR